MGNDLTDRRRHGLVERALFFLIFACSLLPYYLLPAWAGLFIDVFGFGEGQAGILLAVDGAGGTLAAFSARYWIHRTVWRPTLLMVSLVAAVANGLCVATTDFYLLLGLRTLAGIACGSMMAFSYAFIAGVDEPDREFGLALGLQAQ